MLKIYISSVIIWFIIFMSEGLLLKKQFIKSRDKLRKELNDNSKINGNIKTMFTYLLISCIPIIRFIVFLVKTVFTLYPDEYIKAVNDNKKE